MPVAGDGLLEIKAGTKMVVGQMSIRPELDPSMEEASVVLSIGGMTCRKCPPAVEKALQSLVGVEAARANLSNQLVEIRYDAKLASILDFAKTVRAAGFSVGSAKTRFLIKNMHCSSC